MKTVLVFGNEDFEYDDKAIKLIPLLKERLKECAFYPLSRPEQVMDFFQQDFIILDVAKGIEEAVLITNLDDIKYGKKITAHDMDLAAFLKTVNELGELNEVKIVAIPNDKEPNIEKIVEIINSVK